MQSILKEKKNAFENVVCKVVAICLGFNALIPLGLVLMSGSIIVNAPNILVQVLHETYRRWKGGYGNFGTFQYKDHLSA